MKNIFISIIIANFNGEKYLNTCIKSVLTSLYKNYELILVDDCSTDKSLKIIEDFQKRDKRIILFKNTKNMGAAASRNIAIKKAKGEIIVFLDNDTEVDVYWVGNLIECLQKEDVGAVQSLILDFENRNLIQMAGGLLIPQTAWLIPFFQWNKLSDVKLKIYQRNIIGISASLAARKQVLEKIGMFDEKEAIYTEDLDLCWRIWLAGYRVILAPKSIIYHWTKSVKQRKIMKADYKQIYFHLAKNSFRSIIKNYEIINILKHLPLSIIINVCRGL